MSGQPYRYASDREMYREMYMKDLQDRIDLDEQVYQAVMGYVSNGTLPAVSQIPDTRTTSQKLLDVEKLKQILIKDLEPIMDPNIASEFIQALVQSPLNIDNKLVIFLSQNSTELIKELSKKYKYGIKGDSNDIYTFVEFVNNAYAIINNTKASVKSVLDSGYSKSGTGGMANRQDLEQFLFDLQKSFGQASIARLPHANIQEIENWLEQIRSKIAGLVRFLPTDNQMTQMENVLTMSAIPLDANLLEAISHLFGWMKESLPNKQYIISLSNSVSREVMTPINTGRPADINVIIRSLEAIFNYLPYIHDIDLKYDVQQIMNAIGPAGGPGGPGMGGQPPPQPPGGVIGGPQFPGGGQTLGGPPSGPGGGPGGGPDPRRQSFLEAIEKKKELPEEFYDDANTQDFYDQYPAQRPVSPSSSISSYATPLEATPTRNGDRSTDTDNKIQRLLEDRRDMFRHYHKKFKEPDIKSPQMLERSQGLAIGRSNDALVKQGFDMSLLEKIDRATFSGLQGEGIVKRRGRPKGTGFKQNIEKHIDTQKGIQPDFRFSKFGKYLIRNDHLMDNKVSIRTGKGLNIAGLPSTTTSHRVINVIKKIIGGALPTFDEMSKLGEDEKKYLHDISKKSNILEKLNIPTPSKDKEEKDFNEFEILRGEIMAGNDNKDMVRKFKGYLLKFSKTGQLPKQQVNEILQDMLDMNL